MIVRASPSGWPFFSATIPSSEVCLADLSAVASAKVEAVKATTGFEGLIQASQHRDV
jgi:hypothetical protein